MHGAHSQNRIHRRAGYTMVEMMVTAFISTAMFMTVVAAAQTGMISMRATDARVTLSDALRQAMGEFVREVSQTSPQAVNGHLFISSDAQNNSIVEFQVPVDADGDGDAINNSNGAVQWGAYQSFGSGAMLGRWLRYTLQGDQVVRQVLVADRSAVDATVPAKVIANEISQFSVTKNGTRLSVRLKASRQDTTFAKLPRTYTDAQNTQVTLRNNVQ